MEVADDGHAQALLLESLDNVGMALAASSLLTVTRTTSLPARARAATCLMVRDVGGVGVGMDCTMTGALLPTRTPLIEAVWVFLRWIGP